MLDYCVLLGGGLNDEPLQAKVISKAAHHSVSTNMSN